MNHTHLTDDELIAMCVDTSDAPVGDSQAAVCPHCQSRRAALAGLLDEIGDVATATTDAAFPPEKLTRQQARIEQRLDMIGHVGRVIAFPAAPPPRATSMMHPKPVRRWVAGAAAAGLLIGMVAGHLVHEIPTFGPPVQGQPTTLARQGTGTFTASQADAELLSEVEAAVRFGPAGLRRLDQITPISWSEPR
jgi:hypothetical protein